MVPAPTILIVDDESGVRKAVEARLRAEGHIVREALVCQLKGRGPGRQLFFTGSGPVANVVRTHAGWQCGTANLPADRVETFAPCAKSEAADRADYDDGDMVAASASMQHVLKQVSQVADVDSNVLITGESGTGKDVIARLLAERSKRRRRPFVALNCAAIPETLIESELFGHRKGAFTGATEDRKGLFEAADSGVLFLDEIGEMPLVAQSRLLRFVDSREVRRVGDTATSRVDVRIIAATNRALEEEVRLGRFRLDLFYRLNVVRLRVPSLRERVADIAPLAERFVRRAAARLDRPAPTLDASGAELLETYDWPGNVRELQNVVERVVIGSSGRTISAPDVAAALDDGFVRDCLHQPPSTLARRPLIERAGNLRDVAGALGISRTTLWRRLKAQRRAGAILPARAEGVVSVE